MRKFILLLVLFSLNVNGQSKFSIGLNGNYPLESAESIFEFAISPELSYSASVAKWLDLGLSVSYYHLFGKELTAQIVKKESWDLIGITARRVKTKIKVGDVSFVPLSFTIRFKPIHQLGIGANLGYIIDKSSNFSSSEYFYYKPLITYTFSDKFTVQAGYTGMSVLSFVSLGLLINL